MRGCSGSRKDESHHSVRRQRWWWPGWRSRLAESGEHLKVVATCASSRVHQPPSLHSRSSRRARKDKWLYLLHLHLVFYLSHATLYTYNLADFFFLPRGAQQCLRIIKESEPRVPVNAFLVFFFFWFIFN